MLRQGDEPVPGYRLVRFLGKGQFGEVWMSTSPGKTHAALKFLDLNGKEGWKEFHGIQHVKQIRHAHLMPITALWLLDGEGKVLGDAVLDEMEVRASSSSDTIKGTLIPDSNLETNTKTDTSGETLSSGGSIDESLVPKWLVVANLLGDKSLADVLEEHRKQGKPGIPEAELLRYMEESAKGIDFLNSPKHDFGAGPVAMQHCDIKPANMLLVGDSVLICDFGVSRVLGDTGVSSTATNMVGSMAYMSPECISRKPSFASDQYSLAITYIELKSGELPFRDKSFQAVLMTHQTGDFDFSGVSQEEAVVLKKATSRNPSDRFESSTEFVQALKSAINAGKEKTQRAIKKPSLLAPIAAVGAVLVATVIAIFFYFSGGREGPTPNPVTLELTPIQVIVSPPIPLEIDGQLHEPDGQGVIKIERTSDATVEINFAGNDKYRGTNQKVPVREFENSKYRLPLEVQPSFIFQQAMQEFRKGDFDSATRIFAEAIQADSRFAAVPDPITISHSNEKIDLMVLTNDGESLITATEAGIVRIGKLTTDSFESKVLFHQDGFVAEKIVIGNNTSGISGISDGLDQIWVVDLDGSAGRIEGHGNSVSELSISSDGKWLASISDLEDSSVSQIWELARKDAKPRNLSTNFTDRLMFLADQAIVAAGDGVVYAWLLNQLYQEPLTIETGVDSFQSFVSADTYLVIGAENKMADGKCHAKIIPLDGTSSWDLPMGHDDQVQAITVTEDGHWLATGSAGTNPTIHVWNILDNKPIGPTEFRGDHSEGVIQLAIDPTQKWLISTSPKEVVLHDLSDSEHRVLEFGPQSDRVKQTLVSGDGKWVVVLTQDGRIGIWDLEFCKWLKKACDLAKVVPFVKRVRVTELDSI